MEPRTPDRPVRDQIEAAKEYLAAEGFTDLDDAVQPAVSVQRNLHTIYMRFAGDPRVLRLSYAWLEEHTPPGLRHALEEREIGKLLNRHPPDVSVGGDGTVEHSPS